MDVFECIRSRRSVRSFQDRPVDDEILRQVLDAARRAPSANNRQNWKFVVVRDAELRKGLAAAAMDQTFVGEAPVVIVACATKTDHVMPCGHPAHLVDVAIAIEHMALAARALGLGTCWIGAFRQEDVKRVLGIPKSVQVIELLPIGYPASWPPETSRKHLDEIVCYDRWQ
jgi:nitroreductase